jgi:glutamate formiminotransferase/formiminotetrahydrofolate cyclodeaminase
MQLIECVPNFSEGNRPDIIQQITDSISQVPGVRLLNVDAGKATNRTVVTFVGTPAAVVEAAFAGISKAGELIDMRQHKGEHPRMGATDVCPLIPIANISMEETAAYARELAKKVGETLQLPVYLYEAAQPDKSRSNLSVIRAGEYEGLEQKLADPNWQPDFGPAKFDTRRGATVIGARDFLIAYNINLNTTSTRRANAIAFDVREAGRVKTENGKPVKDEQGNNIVVPGSLKSVKAIGWYIAEYGIAQISMNLTNINITPLHVAFDEVCNKAAARGIRVTGSELVGLVPLQCLLDAGKYFLMKQQRSAGVGNEELIRMAIKTMGLDELSPFKPEERIIEYLLQRPEEEALVNTSLKAFAAQTASESPAPGGGSIAAYVGSLGAALGTMVANLSSHKKGWDHQWQQFSQWAEQGQQYQQQLLRLVDEDTQAFNAIMQAMALPKNSPAEKENRSLGIQKATRVAMEVPYRVMEIGLAAMPLLKAMAEAGNPNSVSDAGVGALCLRTAVLGALMNVRINASGLEDGEYKSQLLQKANTIASEVVAYETEIVQLVNQKIDAQV